jgi:hypothetical protein
MEGALSEFQLPARDEKKVVPSLGVMGQPCQQGVKFHLVFFRLPIVQGCVGVII